MNQLLMEQYEKRTQVNASPHIRCLLRTSEQVGNQNHTKVKEESLDETRFNQNGALQLEELV